MIMIILILTSRGLFHPACLASATSWLAIDVPIFIGHKNGDNNGEPRNGICMQAMLVEKDSVTTVYISRCCTTAAVGLSGGKCLSQTAFTRRRHILKTIDNSTITNSVQFLHFILKTLKNVSFS